MAKVYDGELPVTEDWATEHEGAEVTFHLWCSLYDLIGSDGPDGFGEMLDETLGVVLTNWKLAVVREARLDWGRFADYELQVAVTGEVAEF